MTNISVESDNPNYQSIDGNLYTKDGKTLIQYAIGKTATSFVVSDSVTSIGYNAFEHCNNLTKVYYQGTASDWEKISIDFQNDSLKNATCYYYSETKPTTTGNYWHCVDGVPTPWEQA